MLEIYRWILKSGPHDVRWEKVKRGPHGPHKLQGAVLQFIQEQVVAGEPIRARQLAKLIRKKFNLDVHPRTIERAVGVKKTVR